MREPFDLLETRRVGGDLGKQHPTAARRPARPGPPRLKRVAIEIAAARTTSVR